MSDKVSPLEILILDFIRQLNVSGGREWRVGLSRDTDLLERGVIDSFNIIEIAAFLENEFNIRIESEEIRQENFASVSRLARLVLQIQEKRDPA